METFFPEPLTYWAGAPASCTALVTNAAWPPAIGAIGYAACVRAWKPQEGPQPGVPELAPVLGLSEVDGSRKSAIAMHGTLLAVGDMSSSGLVSIWDTASWQRKQTLQAGSPVSQLVMNADFIAAGTSTGSIRVWKREGDTFERPAGSQDLQVEPAGQPCMTVCLGEAPDGACLLVGHSAARSRLSVWRLTDGQLLQTLGCVVDATNAASMAAQTNVQFAFMDGWMLTMVSWLQGHETSIQVMDVLARQSQDLKAPDRLQGRGRPLAADFRGGKLLAIGFEDGAVAAFGFHGWLRFHAGSVGAVRVLPDRMQVATGGADGYVRLWSGEGALLAAVHVGFQVTALTAGDIHLVAGGARGEVQLLVLAAQDPAKTEGAASSDSNTLATTSPPQQVTQYSLFFDSRGAKDGPGGGVQGKAEDHKDAFTAFTFPHKPSISPEQLLAFAGLEPGTAGGDAAGSAGGSRFDTKAAASGASRVPEELEREAAEQAEALKKKKLAQMGEGAGVARTPSVVLESNTARIGRKCDSVSCLAREGVGGTTFKRCGACRSVWYCSAHCQQTHWRDRHSKECMQMAAAFKERLKQEKTEEEERRAAAKAVDQEAVEKAGCSVVAAESQTVADAHTEPVKPAEAVEAAGAGPTLTAGDADGTGAQHPTGVPLDHSVAAINLDEMD